MAYTNVIKNKALALRSHGASLNEIVKTLGIAKSTASLWVKDYPLSLSLKKTLLAKQNQGQKNAVSMKQLNKEREVDRVKQNATQSISSIQFTNNLDKLLCSVLWWCEGNKGLTYVRFTNSDPTLIYSFLSLLRSGFVINESKLRVLVQIHPYHNDSIQKQYWSNITQIPLTQFHNSFHKNHTGKRKHNNYQGCIAISYYDAKIAKELQAIYNSFTRSRGVR